MCFLLDTGLLKFFKLFLNMLHISYRHVFVECLKNLFHSLTSVQMNSRSEARRNGKCQWEKTYQSYEVSILEKLRDITLRWTEVWGRGAKLRRALEVRRWNTVFYLKFQIDRVRSLKIVIFSITVIDEREEFHVREIFKLTFNWYKRLENLHILIE